jgi:hypothetical protein
MEAPLYIQDKPLKEVFPLLVFDYMSVLAVYQDEEGEIYLGKVSDWRNGIIFVVSKTTKKIIRDLINQKISINIALKRGSMIKYLVTFKDKKWTTEVKRFNQLNKYDLANYGIYLKYMEDDIEENFKKFFKEEL